MAKNYYDITLSLSGMCQASYLLQSLAQKGICCASDAKTMVNSLTNMNPSSTLDVYGNDPANLQTGLDTMISMLSGKSSTRGLCAEITHYILTIIVLERRLNKNQQAINQLSQRIAQFERQVNYFEPISDNVFNALAGIYIDIIKPLGPYIQVTGSPYVMKNTVIQAKASTLLLSGIRSAVLWQQVGGSRMQLMFTRKHLIKHAQDILSHL